MATATAPQHSADGGEADAVRRDIARAWRGYFEDPAGALDVAARGYESGRSVGDGLHNRRYMAREIERLTQERMAGRMSLAVLDVDHFKAINDRFGHAGGDGVLIRIAGLLCDHLRESDSIIRSGGEEFIILMPRTDAKAATACCERIRQSVHSEAWSSVADGLRGDREPRRRHDRASGRPRSPHPAR